MQGKRVTIVSIYLFVAAVIPLLFSLNIHYYLFYLDILIYQFIIIHCVVLHVNSDNHYELFISFYVYVHSVQEYYAK
jgi:hypothetical protein